MGADSVRVAIGAEATERAPAGASSLTRRAVLTAIASLLDYTAQIAVTLFVTPIVVGRLGASLFGIWEMLRQAVGYMSAADGRPMDALRLVVAADQGKPDAGRLRRNIAAALVAWLIFLPLAMIAGGVLIWLSPTIAGVGPEMSATVRVACALLVGTFITTALSAIPEAVLRGMNLGYKRMGWQAALSVTGGLLAAGAVYSGLGVVGLGAAQLVLAGLTGLCFVLLTRRFVPAFGVARPERAEVMSLLRMSAWLTGGLVLSNALLASDVLILGMVVSPAVVTTYVLTGASTRMAVTLFNFTVGATIPGLGGLMGQREYDRAARIRGELVTMTWLFTTVVGAAILVANRSFVSLWVGADHYAGGWVNLLIVCIMAQTAFIRGDAFVIDAALRPRPRVIVTAIAAALTLAATLALTPVFGIVGLCLGILAGRLPQTIAYPVLAASCLERRGVLPVARVARQGAVMLGIFAAAAWLGDRVVARDWLEWIAVGAVALPAALSVALVAGLSTDERRAMIRRGLSMGRSFRG
jgi:O-antigen/teichoic acid export membrane protein